MLWLKKWGASLIMGLLGLFGFGALIAARRRKAALLQAENNAAVIAARSRVQELRAIRATLQERSNERSVEIEALDHAINEHKGAIASVQAAHGLTAQEIADEFAKLGY